MIAYYMRLSRAQDREGESQSIENQRKVKTIMAEDVSRIGRNYIKVEDYLNRILPMLGVLVICVIENYDSGRQSRARSSAWKTS